MTAPLAFIGVDPGKSGGWSIVYPDGTAEAYAFDSESEITDWLHARAHNQANGSMRYSVAIELVGGFIKGNRSPGSAMFEFGSNAGFWRGAISMARLPFRYVRPQVWQAGLPGVAGDKEKASRKRTMRDIARQRYPQLNATLGTADAILIADWLRQQPQ